MGYYYDEQDRAEKENYRNVSSDPHDYRLKWHFLVVYGLLTANIAINVLKIIQFRAGSIYRGMAELFYGYSTPLKNMDIILVIALAALAAGTPVVQIKLARYRRNASLWLQACCALYLLVYIGHAVFTGEILGTFEFTMDIPWWICAAINILMIATGKAYYDKRAELFVR